MTVQDITLASMAICFLLLIIPFSIGIFLKVPFIGSASIAIVRMLIQLSLVGIFLEYIFEMNNPLINGLWLAVMIVFASFSAVNSSELRISSFIMPVLAAFTISTVSILAYFNGLIVRLNDLTDARYLIAIGGMLLGNSLSGVIIGINGFYKNIKRNSNRYQNSLAMGASRFEALIDYFRESLSTALKPTIANISTIGIVFLPGLMTGQILSGASPYVAIKYQIAIMTAIFVTITLSVSLSVLLTIKSSFDDYGMMREDIFKHAK